MSGNTPTPAEALREAAEHFDSIANKALHWMQVCQKNEIAEARWSQIKNHAHFRATEARAAVPLAEAQETIAAAVLAAWRATENPGHSDLDNEQPIALDVHLTLGDLRRLAMRAPAPGGRCPNAVAAGERAEAEGAGR